MNITVVSIIQKCAKQLEIELTAENLKTLLHCYNSVENELAHKFSLFSNDTIKVIDNKIEYTKFTYAPIKIIKVYNDKNENKEIKFKLFPTYMQIKGDYEVVDVEYNYSPNSKRLVDFCEFDEDFENALIYGTCSEYCLIMCEYEAEKQWDAKYLAEIVKLKGAD